MAVTELKKKISYETEKISSSQVTLPDGLTKKKSINDQGEEETSDYCSICYTNIIQLAPTKITDDLTFEFSECKHRFCIECCQEQLKMHIDRAEVGKLVCFEYKCGAKVTQAELELLFKQD